MVEYQIPAGAGLVIGMGSMNITYWEGRAPQPASGRVVFDRKSALPRRETLLAADGSVVATLAFADYALLAPDPAGGDSRQVPRSVQVVIPRTAAGGHHLRFDLQYGVRDGVWAFQEGRTTRITDAGEELLALASLRDFTVHGTKANEGAQPATRPQGTSRPSQPAPDEKPPGEKSPGEESSGEKSGSQ